MLPKYLRGIFGIAARSSWIAANGIAGAVLAGLALIWPGVLTLFPEPTDTTVTSWEYQANWGLSFLLYAVIAWIVLFCIQVVFFAPFQLWKRDRKNDAAIEQLARLRTEGVNLRNEGQAIRDPATLIGWETRILGWNDKVIAALQTVSRAEAELFSTLDTVPEPRIPISSSIPMEQDAFAGGQHRKAYREHDFRLVKLDKSLENLKTMFR